MKEVSYLLVFDNDLITSSMLTLGIYQAKPYSPLYQAASTQQALDLLELIWQEEEANYGKEVCVVVDLNMGQLEGYVFLIALEQYQLKSAVRVYVLADESEPADQRPSFGNRYQLAGVFHKPFELEAIAKITDDPSPKFFQKRLPVGKAACYS